MLIIFRNLLDMEDSDTMGVMRGTKTTSLMNRNSYVKYLHKLSRLVRNTRYFIEKS